MRRYSLTILATLIALTCAHADESSLRLELESPVKTLRLGQSKKLKLKISGSDVHQITESSEGIDINHMRAGTFVYEFNFKPQRKGIFTFGPYSVEFNGQKLTSNQIKIDVLPQWEGTYGTCFRVDTNSIELGESIEFVMETWSKDRGGYISISLNRDESFSSSMGGGMSSSSFSSDDGTVSYRTRSWSVTPKTAGEFRITKELFKEFPDNIQAPDITVQVKETK